MRLLNYKNNISRTPLHYACKECVITLLEHGADFKLKDDYGKTAFDIASMSCQEIIKKWIEDDELIKEPCVQ